MKDKVSMKQLYAFGKKRKIDLSLSENPLGCSNVVIESLNELKFIFNDYPKPNGISLKQKLAVVNDLQPANFFVANGSEAIICSLTRLFNGEVLVPSLTFPMFKTCSLLAGSTVKEVAMTKNLGINLNGFKKLMSNKTKMIFLCNPNNPTGSTLPKKKMVNFLTSLPKNIILVVDEANIEFGGESMVDQVKTKPNLVVLRTFSKGFGLASLRVGFAVANNKIVAKLETINQPFATSGLSELLVSKALADQEFINRTKKFVSAQRKLLTKSLIKLGFKVFPSKANNLFVNLPNNISIDQFEKFLVTEDISVVMGESFARFDNSFFRLSIRDKKTNQLFLKKLEKFLRL